MGLGDRAKLRLFALMVLISAVGLTAVVHQAPWLPRPHVETVTAALVFIVWPLLYVVLVGGRMRTVRPLLLVVLCGVVMGSVVLPAWEKHLWRYVDDLRWLASGALMMVESWVLWLLLSSLARRCATPDDPIAFSRALINCLPMPAEPTPSPAGS